MNNGSTKVSHILAGRGVVVGASSTLAGACTSLNTTSLCGLGIHRPADARCHFSSVSALSLTSKKRHGHKISMVTAYDFPSAVHVARAGIDVLLVGDSAAMVEMGYETTQPITLEHMIVHCQSVKRGIQYAGSPTPLLVGDMPFGSYEFEDTDVALRNAYRLVKEAGMDAVKLEVSILLKILHVLSA